MFTLRLRKRMALACVLAILLNLFSPVFTGSISTAAAEEPVSADGNVAKGKVVVASSPATDAPKVIDGLVNGATGTTNSRWYVAAASANGAFIEIDLGAEYKIGSSVIFSGYDTVGKPDDIAKNYVLQWWNGGQWENIEGADVTNNLEQTKYIHFKNSVSTNKVRFLYKGAEAFRVREIAIYKAEEDGNVAYAKQVYASSFNDAGAYSTYTRKYPWFAVNGGSNSDEEFWQPKPTAGELESWLEINFGRKFDVNSAQIYTGNLNGSNVLQNFKLQYFNEDNWADIPGTTVLANTQGFANIEFASVNTDKIRLICQQDSSTKFVIREIKVFRDPAVVNKVPYISLITPEQGSEVFAGAEITVTSEVYDPDGLLYSTDIYIDGIAAAKDNIINAPGTDIYSYIIRGLTPGTHTVQIKASDDEGGVSDSDLRKITVKEADNIFPSVSITNPGIGEVLKSGTEITVTAEVYDVDNGIQKVEFYINNELLPMEGVIHQEGSELYSYKLVGLSIGTYRLMAKAFDIKGAASTNEIDIKIQEQKPKRVYADYHGPRFTRDINGATGQWSYTGTASKSSASQTFFNYNADVIDENGKNQIASVAYPEVGMQSQNDPDYIEYQILMAKAAHIDGFFVEWGFQEHSSNQQLKLMQQVAQKYNFEIGVNWCDAWLFYDWITNYRPEVDTREEKVNAFKGELQYLVDNVFNSATGPKYDGHPLIYMFGGGPTPQEFKDIKAANYLIPEGLKTPWFFRRAPMDAKLDTAGNVNYIYNNTDWHKVSEDGALTDGPFGWIPARARLAAKDGFNNWDKYATGDDTVKYLDVLKQGLSDNNGSIKLRNSVVTPGMDNRGCAGWGTDLSYIPRNNGQTYEGMWEYNVQNKEDVDVVYIASWNDYTEGHQIEPTIADGEREILTTQKYAAQFKGEVQNSAEGVQLPSKLFDLRKKYQLYKKAGAADDILTNISTKLDQAAAEISNSNYGNADLLLNEVKQICDAQESKVTKVKKSFSLSSQGIKVTAPSSENVAFNKSVTASVNNEQAAKVTDGITADDSAYQANGQESYWIEIDLQEVYNLTGGEILSGTKEGAETVKNVRLQYLEGEVWKDIPGTIAGGNTSPDLNFKFQKSLNFQKVRMLSEDGLNGIKVREIKLFANRFPEVSIIAPATGLTILPKKPLEIKVAASDRDGSVKKVEIYVDGMPLSNTETKVTGANEYSIVLGGLERGEHSVQATAIDNGGASATSQEIRVKADYPLVNVAENKPFNTSSEMSDSPAKYAVDGIIDDNLRWRTNTTDAEHWMEIDLQEEKTIQGAEFITGYSNGGWAVKNMKLQAWDGSVWKDIPGLEVLNNTKIQVKLTASEQISTSKVRFYSNDGTRGLRIREIIVYAYDELPPVTEEPSNDNSDNDEQGDNNTTTGGNAGNEVKTDVLFENENIKATSLTEKESDKYLNNLREGLPANAELVPVGSVLDLEVKQVNEKEPANVLLPLTMNNKNIDVEKLGVFNYDEATAKWIYIGGKVDKEGKNIAFNISTSGKYAVMENNITFRDINGHWAQRSIEVMGSKYIALGLQDGSFNPEEDITRAEFIAGIARAAGIKPVKYSGTFRDVGADSWYADIIQAFADKGYILGGENKNVKPDESITREEMAIIIARIFSPSGDTAQTPNISEGISDFEKVSDWAKESIQYVLKEGIIIGQPSGEIEPQANATRAQAMVVIKRIFDKLE